MSRRAFGQTAFLFGNASEALAFLSIDDSEKDGVDDFASRGGQPEADIEDAEDGFDVRDLLLDETD